MKCKITQNKSPLWAKSLTFVSAMRKNEPHGYAYPFHQHPFYEIGILKAGKSKWLFDEEKVVNFNVDDAILLSPGQVHREHSPDPLPVSYFFVCFKVNDPEFIPGSLSLKPVSMKKHATEIEHLASNIIREQSNQHLGRDDYLSTLVKQLLILFDRCANKKQTSPEKDSGLNQHQRGIVISAARAFCDGPFSSGFVSEIAHHFGISLPYFSSLFKSYHGETPRDFIQRQRLDKAKFLLKDSQLRIKEIAFELDYNDPVHFCHHFKKATNQTPNEYRGLAKK